MTFLISKAEIILLSAPKKLNCTINNSYYVLHDSSVVPGTNPWTLYVQLTLEQNEFELWESIYTDFFPQ